MGARWAGGTWTSTRATNADVCEDTDAVSRAGLWRRGSSKSEPRGPASGPTSGRPSPLPAAQPSASRGAETPALPKTGKDPTQSRRLQPGLGRSAPKQERNWSKRAQNSPIPGQSWSKLDQMWSNPADMGRLWSKSADNTKDQHVTRRATTDFALSSLGPARRSRGKMAAPVGPEGSPASSLASMHGSRGAPGGALLQRPWAKAKTAPIRENHGADSIQSDIFPTVLDLAHIWLKPARCGREHPKFSRNQLLSFGRMQPETNQVWPNTTQIASKAARAWSKSARFGRR